MKLIFLFFVALALLSSPANAVTITADPSDFEVFSTGPGGDNLGDFGVGDTGGAEPNLGRRGVLQFSLAGLSGQTVQAATLNLFIIESRKDQFPAPGIIDSTAPLTNPGLGNTIVVHIANYVTPNLAAFNSASLGNDPGILIGGATEPGKNVSIDVRAAMQQAINAGSAFVTFRIQTATLTDNDGLNDIWFFASANNTTTANRPTIEFTATPSTGKIPEPASLLLFGIALIGLVAGQRWRSVNR